MMEMIQNVLSKATDALEKSYNHTQREIMEIGTNATPKMLIDITVNYHGVQTPLHQVANITIASPRELQIVPWEKQLLHEIEKAIIQHPNNTFNPQNIGEKIIVSFPPLTEEFRKKLTKEVDEKIEHCKIRLRDARKKATQELRKLQKEGAAEDNVKKILDALQKKVDEYVVMAENLRKKKKETLLKV